MKTNNSIQLVRRFAFQNCHTADARLWAWCGMALALSANIIASAGTHDHQHESLSIVKPPPTTRSSGPESPAQKLPPLRAGVTELKFNEFFVSPVGPRGLELTDKLRGLAGRRVRILGYMAHRDAQPPGVFLLTPFPIQVHDHDNGLAEDFPASVVQVAVPTLRDQPVPHVPGLMLLTGTLSIGNRGEPDGRVSLVRLELDPPSKIARQKTFPRGTNGAKGAAMLVKRLPVLASKSDADSHQTQTTSQ